MDATGIGAVSDLASTVISKIWPDKTVQEREQLAATVALIQGQMDINKAEASNPNMFIAGWRPAIGWICGGALGWNYIVRPALVAGMALYGHPITLPSADMVELMPVLLGMLGLSGMRTFERVSGVIPNGK
jgi:hypothetical protein